MMNHSHFVRDLTYKLTESPAILTHQEGPALIFQLWRPNRLSLLRAVAFITLFFPCVSIHKQKIIIRIRHSTKLNKKKFLLTLIVPTTTSFFDVVHALPEPKVVKTFHGCVLIFPHYRFLMRMYIKSNLPIFVYKLMPYLQRLNKWPHI